LVTSRRPHPSITDPDRLAALRSADLLGDDADPSLDRWTRLASGLIGAPIALLSLVERDRQSFASQYGLPEDRAAAGGTPLSHAICQHVVASGETLVITDGARDPRVRDNGAVTDHGIAAYAGHPVTAGGHTIGSFCVQDTRARTWTGRELLLLDDLAAGLQAELDLRAAVRDAGRLEAVLQHQARHDPLTHLANRRQLEADLAGALASGTDRILAVFDLDGFKAYNDMFGHPAGDALLLRLSARLGAAVAGSGTAYRLGGDEFCILTSEPASIQRAVAALYEQGESFSVGSSCGVVDLPAEARDSGTPCSSPTPACTGRRARAPARRDARRTTCCSRRCASASRSSTTTSAASPGSRGASARGSG
jgi:GGDEF domain-containing protein